MRRIALYILIGFTLFSCEKFGDVFETRVERPEVKPITFIKQLDFGIGIEIIQNQDPVKNQIAINSTLKIDTSQFKIENIDFIVTVRKNTSDNSRILIQRRFNIQNFKDDDAEKDLAKDIGELFDSESVTISLISLNNNSFDLAEVYSGLTAGYKNGELSKASLTDIIIDHKGQFSSDLHSEIFGMRYMKGLFVSEKNLLGEAMATDNTKLGDVEGRLLTSLSSDSLNISITLKNTSDLDSVILKLIKI